MNTPVALLVMTLAALVSFTNSAQASIEKARCVSRDQSIALRLDFRATKVVVLVEANNQQGDLRSNVNETIVMPLASDELQLRAPWVAFNAKNVAGQNLTLKFNTREFLQKPNSNAHIAISPDWTDTYESMNLLTCNAI